jgi:hypothetical protein
MPLLHLVFLSPFMTKFHDGTSMWYERRCPYRCSLNLLIGELFLPLGGKIIWVGLPVPVLVKTSDIGVDVGFCFAMLVRSLGTRGAPVQVILNLLFLKLIL